MFQDPWPGDRSLLKTIAGFSIPILLVGAFGYRYLTTATPVTADQALELFRAEREVAAGADTRAKEPGRRMQRPRLSAAGEDTDRSARRGRSSRPAARSQQIVKASAPEQQTGSADRSPRAARSHRSAPAFSPGAPKEGVYSWSTEGYESFNGSRRAFPPETQRIVTRHGATSWTLHHYFSEERESWTDVSTDESGYASSEQRNKVVFGPVTRDVTITFDPPMVTGPMPPRVGSTWSGKWTGKTYGTYSGRYFEKTSIAIDGEPVDVWGIELRIHLRGETEGETWARVWVSPESHMVVREHYRQDVRSGPGTYKAEWLMTIESMEPRR